jgi:hypothetical protein
VPSLYFVLYREKSLIWVNCLNGKFFPVPRIPFFANMIVNKGGEADSIEGKGEQENAEPTVSTVKVAQMLHCLNVVQSDIDANVSDDAKTMLIKSKVRELYGMLEDVSLSNKKQSFITGVSK